jgi:hypothetical protein
MLNNDNMIAVTILVAMVAMIIVIAELLVKRRTVLITVVKMHLFNPVFTGYTALDNPTFIFEVHLDIDSHNTNSIVTDNLGVFAVLYGVCLFVRLADRIGIAKTSLIALLRDTFNLFGNPIERGYGHVVSSHV